VVEAWRTRSRATRAPRGRPLAYAAESRSKPSSFELGANIVEDPPHVVALVLRAQRPDPTKLVLQTRDDPLRPLLDDAARRCGAFELGSGTLRRRESLITLFGRRGQHGLQRLLTVL
jgi:hypothetical protein